MSIPEACFIYAHDPAVMDKMIELNEELQTNNEERIFARYCDNITKEWKGVDEYNKLFGVPYVVGGKGRIKSRKERAKLFQHIVSSKAQWLWSKLKTSTDPKHLIQSNFNKGALKK